MISAVVPVWNGRALLERLLATLAAQTCPADELLVVDNGSEDGAPEVARSAGARVIPMGRNAGFAAAVNCGIRESRGEWVAVLNSDVELAPDYFQRLSGAHGWFATGRILRAADESRIDGTFDLTCRGGATWRAGNGALDGPRFRASRRIFSAPWTAALFRAELFRKVGLLAECFESYLEDVDFGLRCARAGCEGEYLPDAVARHHGSAALGRWHPETVRLISPQSGIAAGAALSGKIAGGVDVAHRRGPGIMGRGGVAAWRGPGVVQRQTARGSRVLRRARA